MSAVGSYVEGLRSVLMTVLPGEGVGKKKGRGRDPHGSGPSADRRLPTKNNERDFARYQGLTQLASVRAICEAGLSEF